VKAIAVDPSFTRPAMASFRLASAFARGCGPYLGWLAMVQVLEALLPLASGEGLPCLEHAEFPLALVVARTEEAAARDLRALTDAFAEVCSERTGLAPQTVLAFWVPEMAAALEDAERWIGGLQADAALKERFKAGLDHVWTLGD